MVETTSARTRFIGSVAAIMVIFAGCGRGEQNSAQAGDTGAGDTSGIESVNSGTVTSGGPPDPNFPSAGSMQAGGAPMTSGGRTHEVRMVGDAQGFRFEPANLVVSSGDQVRFTVAAGGPHNITFDGAGVPPNSHNQLDSNISERMGSLSSAMKTNPGESVTVSFASVPKGQYPYFCAPHGSLGMRGQITVQ